jgi:hypothetical protein
MYDRRMKATKKEEQEEIGSIAEKIEEKGSADWGVMPPSAVAGVSMAFDEPVQDDFVQDDYIQVADMDFVASPEWVQAVHTEERHELVTMDNNYIDFDECEVI